MATKTTAEYLAEAIASRHALMTGTSKASVTYRERTIVYRATDMSKLDAYITQLQAQLYAETHNGCLPRRNFHVRW